jgi:hypothetical protein
MTPERIKSAEAIALMLYMVSIGYYAGSHGAAWIVLALGSFLYLAAWLVLEQLKEHLKKRTDLDRVPKPLSE